MESLTLRKAEILWPSVPSTPRFSAPAFGQWLADMRGRKSFEQIAIQLRTELRSDRLKVSRTNVQKWEQGRIPNWLILQAYGAVYEVDLLELVGRLVRAIRVDDSRDLLRHNLEKAGGVKKEDADDPASARIRERETREFYEAVLKQARGLTEELSAVLRSKGVGASATETARRRPRRKAG